MATTKIPNRVQIVAEACVRGQTGLVTVPARLMPGAATTPGHRPPKRLSCQRGVGLAEAYAGYDRLVLFDLCQELREESLVTHALHLRSGQLVQLAAPADECQAPSAAPRGFSPVHPR
ncbi:hypothetical protein ThrDRAFT_02999 [Frankia casuarinae]|nr:hypothetical protein CcI6DRAFT_03924 [Frankia sp. CcI6]EYT91383.1 hypothetical protein ThrDRAFT_02999 [Frankia casuarinae]KDA41789.1 hypothetical protein BMG523Draft_03404 [Frankia sp. BMG5.23]